MDPPASHEGLESSAGSAGIATVFACSSLVALIAVTLLISHVGVTVVARHHAQAAADLAALAAAAVVVDGTEAACAEAEDLAERMQVRIQSCTVTGWDVTISTERNLPISLYGDRVVRAVARAGPADECVNPCAPISSSDVGGDR
nr:Rv3654c family TadE-like protein [Nocardia sp. CNY236]